MEVYLDLSTMLRGIARGCHQLVVADEYGDTFGNELDRLEQVLAAKEADLQRLKTELALKTLYVDELQATLDAQARELEAFDARLQYMEKRVSGNLPQAKPADAQANSTPKEVSKPSRAVPLLIRVRRGMLE